MSLHPHPIPPIPEATVQVAQAAFPKGNVYMTIRDELGTLYTDEDFVVLFPTHGQPAASPWRLALICVFQFIEGLSDRQAAEAVRSRIDWKYALGLELADAGFDFSVLSEFRARLIAGEAEQQLLDRLLSDCQQRGWLKARGKQRTDSTHVLAAVRTLNRLEHVGETLRAALNALAAAASEWLQAQAPPEWFERYSQRVDEYRLPKGEPARQRYAKTIGMAGHRLLEAVAADSAPPWLREVPAVEQLRQVWVHQYTLEAGQVQWRTAADLPPAGTHAESPYDREARYGHKRSTIWTGYKVHLTETCDPASVHLITHVETTPAHIQDVSQTAPIHDALAALPAEHIVDAGYVDGSLLVTSQTDHQVELVGPARPNSGWQAQEPEAYDFSRFTIDWETQTVTCPEGQTNVRWTPSHDVYGNAIIQAKFLRSVCRRCPTRSLCTRAKTEPRTLTFQPRAQQERLQRRREEQRTPEWKARYDIRAGVEGTLSQGTRAFGLRRCRYRGLAKTHLQHLLTAVAMNVVRVWAWLVGTPQAQTRTSRFAALRPCPT